MLILIFYSLLSAACFYLGSRALATHWLWSRYPARINSFMDCAACTGFWWGVIWSATLGRALNLDVGPLPADHLATPLITGLCLLVLTPIIGGLMQRGLDQLGSIE